ncbi:MAG: M15 family metallopeptidase [Hyphomicrobiaceae bacterium]|nr:M15 family metallopeptidase [Hyphomicrobiaceae bacterium]
MISACRLAIATACLVLAACGLANAEPADPIDRLIAAYPDHLARHERGFIIWKDGTRMPFDDGKGPKSFAARLLVPDIEDQFYAPYPYGRSGLPPPHLADPGRVRNQAFFARMYGDCRKGEVQKLLVDVAWLPRHGGGTLKVTRVNGVARQLRRVSEDLERLPARFLRFLVPAAGAFNCRTIAGTARTSPHGFGIAIDIATRPAHYWRWTKDARQGQAPYRNAIPWEIVEIFERHGFIWGGKWYHYDTMHFEYRPELLPARR